MSSPHSELLDEVWDPLRPVAGVFGTYWTTSNMGEAAPGVQTPLSWTAWQGKVDHGLREGAYALGVLRRSERAAIAEPIVSVFYGRTAVKANYLAVLGDRLPGTTGQKVVAAYLGRAPVDIEFRPTKRRYPIIAARMAYSFFAAAWRVRGFARRHTEWWARSVRQVPTLDHPRAVAALRDALEHMDRAIVVQCRTVLCAFQPAYDAMVMLARRAGITDTSILTAAPGAVEMEVVTDIWRASRGELTAEQVAARHGFHGPAEGELSSAVWREDLAPLRRLIEHYATRSDAQNPALADARRRSERAQVQRELLRRLPPLRRPIARILLRLASRRIPLRGVAKRSMVQAVDVARACARRIGTHLAEQGVIDRADDVFYLTVAELTGELPADTRALVARRRARRVVYQGFTIPDAWPATPPTSPFGDQGTRQTEASTLTGIGVSTGIVEGTARVILDPDFGDVDPDDILVAPTTDPSWCSIMFIASALVVDIGGPLSHAAVVAREMNLPCVVNTRTGTRTIRTGDRLRVDGSTGTVQILTRATQPDPTEPAPTQELTHP